MTSVAVQIALAPPTSTCDTGLAEPTWDFDAMPSYGPGASPDASAAPPRPYPWGRRR